MFLIVKKCKNIFFVTVFRSPFSSTAKNFRWILNHTLIGLYIPTPDVKNQGGYRATFSSYSALKVSSPSFRELLRDHRYIDTWVIFQKKARPSYWFLDDLWCIGDGYCFAWYFTFLITSFTHFLSSWQQALNLKRYPWVDIFHCRGSGGGWRGRVILGLARLVTRATLCQGIGFSYSVFFYA